MDNNNPHSDKPILFFDGVCNLCEGFVQWVVKRDKEGIIYYASLQSDFAKEFTASTDLKVQEVSSVILYHQGRFYTESDAPLKLIRLLGYPWKLAYPFIILPRIIRDNIYRWIARNRYRWFGKKEACMIPTPELQNRFLDSVAS
jgi:predicted DCC family thiol-disulfide oxidoreductase YuxK